MRLLGVLLLCCLALRSVFADETNLTFTVDGITYSNVTFGTVTPSSVTVYCVDHVLAFCNTSTVNAVLAEIVEDRCSESWHKTCSIKAIWEMSVQTV